MRDQRHAFESALKPTMSAAVERATGRTGSSFHTNTDLEPMLTLLIFILTPAAATAASDDRQPAIPKAARSPSSAIPLSHDQRQVTAPAS